jgi:hypothetical protein
VLWKEPSSAAGFNSQILGVAGQVVVIRCIDMVSPGVPGIGLQGFRWLDDATGADLWDMHAPEVVSGCSYQWRGRQVMAGGSQLDCATVEAGWSWWVSGYLLSP